MDIRDLDWQQYVTDVCWGIKKYILQDTDSQF